MEEEDYPAIYRSASLSSAASQNQHLFQVGAQYALLFSAAVVALDFNRSSLIVYAMLLIGSTVMLVVAATIRPEKDWYASRALAESLKTSTWRYMMNAHPFDRTDTSAEAKREFADLLSEIASANEHTRKTMKRSAVSGAQLTEKMLKVRASSISDRIEFYLVHRIMNQKTWYINKAQSNRKRFLVFAVLCGLVQATAIVLTLIRLSDSAYLEVWPTEPLLVLASALVGWIQIKKFNELASAYNLTAHEIGMIEAKVSKDLLEKEWSDFVNEAERAFSREHTQWVARQDSPT